MKKVSLALLFLCAGQSCAKTKDATPLAEKWDSPVVKHSTYLFLTVTPQTDLHCLYFAVFPALSTIRHEERRSFARLASLHPINQTSFHYYLAKQIEGFTVSHQMGGDQKEKIKFESEGSLLKLFKKRSIIFGGEFELEFPNLHAEFILQAARDASKNVEWERKKCPEKPEEQP